MAQGDLWHGRFKQLPQCAEVVCRQFRPMYPPVLTIEVDGIGSRTWFGSEKKIHWEDIAGLYYNTGNKQFSVRDNSGRKITHAGFNADGEMFRHEIDKRTGLPMKIARPGMWKTETIEVPYEEMEGDLDERARFSITWPEAQSENEFLKLVAGPPKTVRSWEQGTLEAWSECKAASSTHTQQQREQRSVAFSLHALMIGCLPKCMALLLR